MIAVARERRESLGEKDTGGEDEAERETKRGRVGTANDTARVRMRHTGEKEIEDRSAKNK